MKVSKKMAAVCAAIGAGSLAVITGSTAFASGPSPTPTFQTKYAYCTTDSNGMCTVQHNLGATPEAVVVTPNIVGTNTQYDLHAVRYTWTDETFKVRAMLDKNTPAAHRRGIAFSFFASAPGSASEPPPTSSEPEPTPEPSESGDNDGGIFDPPGATATTTP